MDNEITEIPAVTQKSRVERWSKNGVYFAIVIALLDFTGWRGDVYSGSLPNSIGYFIGSIIGGAILFGIAALMANGIYFVTRKLRGLFK